MLIIFNTNVMRIIIHTDTLLCIKSITILLRVYNIYCYYIYFIIKLLNLLILFLCYFWNIFAASVTQERISERNRVY